MRSWACALGVLLVVGRCSCGETGRALKPNPPKSAEVSAAPSYRTPAGSGFHCVEDGWIHDFFTFAVKGDIVRGHVIETNVSNRAELPMNGAAYGTRITLIPLSGFGSYEGTLSGDSLRISGMTEGGPQPLQCSLTTDARWHAAISQVPPNAPRQLDTRDFLAQDDFAY